MDRREKYHELCVVSVELLVNIGIIDSVIERYPPYVAENFEERIENLIKKLRAEIEIVQGFGEAFDEQD